MKDFIANELYPNSIIFFGFMSFIKCAFKDRWLPKNSVLRKYWNQKMNKTVGKFILDKKGKKDKY